MTKIELIVNSRLLIVEILNDTNSPATMLPINLLTLGSTVIMPPNREFNQPDCRRILEQVEKRISGGWGSPWGGGGGGNHFCDVWGWLWSSCGLAHRSGGLIPVLGGLFAGIGKIFILAGALGAGLPFHGVWALY